MMHSAVCAGLVLCLLRMRLTNAAECELSVVFGESSSWLSPPYCSVTSQPLGPFYPPLPTALHDNTAALYHFSWLTLFSILHCWLFQALLCRKTLTKAPAVENSISTMNISVYHVCWCPQTALRFFEIKHACGEWCNICLSPIHSARFSTYVGLGEEQCSHFFGDISDRINMTFHC